jgi:hypothetical protein
MNYLGVDMYAHNRATRRYGNDTMADLIPTVSLDCPFCGKPTTLVDSRIAEHAERFGFTRCPGSGTFPHIAAQRAASLTADYMLASEGLYE